MEAAELGLFMISACVFGVLLEHPSSLARHALPDPLLRRFLGGLAMGATAVAIIYSPWGRRSGAHFNPGVTLTFLRLGKVKPWDAAFYVTAQFVGGALGVVLAGLALGHLLSHPSVAYAVTVPGPWGQGAAFAAEVAMTFVLMSVILWASNHERLAPFAGLFAASLVATYITVEAPVSGMSLNAARTFGSALPSGTWAGFWVYLTAPLLGMLLAAETRRLLQAQAAHCAKLVHDEGVRCIFCGQATAETTRHERQFREGPPAPVPAPPARAALAKGEPMDVTCRQFVEFLDAYLANELPPAERAEFNGHLAACPSCVSYMKSYEQAIRLGQDALRGTEEPVPVDVPEELIQAILAARNRVG